MIYRAAFPSTVRPSRNTEIVSSGTSRQAAELPWLNREQQPPKRRRSTYLFMPSKTTIRFLASER
jgi:hypothetical protein